MKPGIRYTCYAASVVVLFYSLVCVFYGIRNPAVLVMFLMVAALAGYACFYLLIPAKARLVINCLGAAAVLAAATVTALMLHAAYFSPPDLDDPPGTVVVPGAKISGDQPSIMLGRRLDAALGYLLEHPEANAVVSGGLGEDELYAESSVMKKYLTERGVAPERVFEEDKSTNTGENLAFSAEVIRQHGLDTDIVVCTDAFHELRCAFFAKRNGLSASSIPSETPWGLVPMYYLREWVGLAKALVFGA